MPWVATSRPIVEMLTTSIPAMVRQPLIEILWLILLDATVMLHAADGKNRMRKGSSKRRPKRALANEIGRRDGLQNAALPSARYPENPSGGLASFRDDVEGL